MLLSNKLTYCITTFVFLVAFAALPVMAHENADEHSHTATDANGVLENPPTADHVLSDHPTVTVGAKPDAEDDPPTSIMITRGPNAGTTYVVARVATTRHMGDHDNNPATDDAVFPAVNTVTLRITFSEDVLYTAPADGAITTGLFTSLATRTDGVTPELGDLITVKIGVEDTNELLYYGSADGTSPIVGTAFGSLTTAITSIAVNPVDLTDDDPTTTPNNNSKSMFDITFTLDAGALPVYPEAAFDPTPADPDSGDEADAIEGKNILFEVVVEGGSAEALPDFRAVDPLARWNNLPSNRDASNNARTPDIFTLVPFLPVNPDQNMAPMVSVMATGPSSETAPIEAADLADAEVTFTVTFTDDEVGGSHTDGVVRFNEIMIDNGTVKDFVVSGTATTVVVTPDGAGTVMLTVEEGSITDAGGLMSAEASGSHTIFVVDNDPPDIWVIAPIAPNSDGDLEFLITSNEELWAPGANRTLANDIPALTINDIAIDTAETFPLADGDLSLATAVTTAAPFPWPMGFSWGAEYEDPHTRPLPGGGSETFVASEVEEYYLLVVSPRAAETSVRVEAKANAAEDLARNFTPGAEDQYDPEGDDPTVSISAVNLDDCDPLPAIRGDVDSLHGAMITVNAMDNVGLASGAEITNNEVTVNRGSVVAGSFTKGAPATFNITPDLGVITVEVVIHANAVRDAAGNGNAETKMEFTVGPIFEIPADTILVIHKTPGATYQYLSDQPRLPINQQPPTPAPNIQTDVWCNMPDLEVLFSHITSGANQNYGGTLNLTEADGQAELPQTRDGGNGQSNSVRISEVMWASDLALRGGINDDEAAEQWVEISNNTGDTVRVFLYARTGLDSARNVDDVEDRVGNAYNGSPGSAAWTVPGQNGNSHTGGTAGNFISMHRKWDGAHNRGYVNGTASGNWSASDRRYLTSTAFPNTIPQGEIPYDFVGSPGRPHSINLPRPSTRAAVTAIPGSQVAEDEKLLINEVSNRVDARYEWIELRNYGTQAADLRSFRISKVTAVGTDQALIDFAHNESYKIPAGGVLLLVATDPRYDDDHPLAVGYNIDVNENDQVAGIGLIEDDSPRKAATARYKVVNFQNGGLDDDGEFILIVRSPDNEKGHHEHNHGNRGRAELGGADLDRISDIAGYHPDLVGPDNYPETNPPNLNKTYLWPLVNFNEDMKPREENRGNRTNRLEAGKVRYRQHDVTQHANNANRGTPGNRAGTGTTHHDEGTGHYAFRDAGYTGWGYKRTARRDLRVHNGTPGYHGNIRNTTTNTDTADATVIISEIMYSTGGEDTSLPQWIELYNSSATQAVHLGSGWKLMIEELDVDGNPKDKLVAINFKDHGRVKHIYPQQTVLIAAGNARQSGSDNQPSRVVFPDNRVFNVRRDIGEGKLGGDDGTNTRYQFFNPNAFALVLVDKDGKVADMVGNLDGDARTSDTVAEGMEIPSAISVDPRTNISRRTSIIRVHDDGVARDGMLPIMPVFKKGGIRVNSDDVDPKWGWIPAVNTEREFKITIKSTWYGDEDDYGTPGHRPGLVLPVELSHFRPTLEDGKVTIRWTTESELDNAGFNILRSDTREGEYKQVNAQLIDGAGTTGERNTYKWVDQTAKPNVVYYYQIEDVSFAGERQALAITRLKGLLSAQNKLTTTWSELKASQ